MPDQPLWIPSEKRKSGSNLRRFMDELEISDGLQLQSYEDVLAFSTEKPEAFWLKLWEFCSVIAETHGNRVLIDGDKMPGGRFFPDANLHYAENLLRRNDAEPALIFWGEDKIKITMTWRQLNVRVAQTHRALVKAGIKPGDRVCAVVPNHPETIVAFLAVASLGAIWSSCSPDFGERGILDRFGQIAPKLLFTCDAYFYAGKTHSLSDKIAKVLTQLPSVERTLVIDYTGAATAMAAQLPKAQTLETFRSGESDAPIAFAQMPFDHPLYILYSSGTTGIPKCIVHRAGGIFLRCTTRREPYPAAPSLEAIRVSGDAHE